MCCCGCQIELTEAEQEAVTATLLLYDAKPADQELTEKGTVGEVSKMPPSHANPSRI